jgi:hypothetical protein
VKWTSVAGLPATCVVTLVASPAAPPPTTHAKNGDTLLVNGTQNTVTAKGNCWAVTVMGSSNTVVADSVTHDITGYGCGYDETVFFHNGDPFIWDRGRELGMVNRLQRVGP